MKYASEIKLSLERAVGNLQAGKEYLQKADYEAAASCAAQSAFDTATVLLLDEEIDPGMHGDVITQVHQIFVKGRRLTEEQGESLSRLLGWRQAEGQAAPTPVSADEARRAVEFAESFFAAAKVILEA